MGTNKKNEDKVILFESDELYLNYKYRETAKKLNKNIGIVSYDNDLDTYQKQFQFYPPDVHPLKGDAYIQSPFDKKKYIKIDSFEDYILGAKANCISRIVQILGAKSFNFSIEVDEIKKREIDANGKISAKIFEADASVKKTQMENMNKKFSRKEEYNNPKPPSEKDWDKAYNEAKKYGLLADLNIDKFLEQRKPDEANILQSSEITFTMSNEINSSLDIAINLNVMKGVFGLSANFHETVENKKSILGKMEVQF